MKLSYRIMAPATLLALAWSSLAQASVPSSVLARVDGVTYEPDKADATRVQIRGVFALHTGAKTGFKYSAEVAGYMYYTCQAGQEVACREQWLDIEQAIAKEECAGWGQENIKTASTVRPAGTAPMDADVYDLGMGVKQAYDANGTCPKLLAFGDGADSGPLPPLNDGGSSGSSGASGAVPPSGGTSGTPAPQPGVNNKNGCAFAPSGGPLSALVAVGGVAAALLLARRRRR